MFKLGIKLSFDQKAYKVFTFPLTHFCGFTFISHATNPSTCFALRGRLGKENFLADRELKQVLFRCFMQVFCS